MKQFKFSLCANVFHCLVSLIFRRNSVIVLDVLLVKFRIVIDINVSISIQTLVGISIHAKSILPRVINVIETDVYVWDMSNLVQGQYSVDALFHGSLNVTAPIFQGLGILRKWFGKQ